MIFGIVDTHLDAFEVLFLYLHKLFHTELLNFSFSISQGVCDPKLELDNLDFNVIEKCKKKKI